MSLFHRSPVSKLPADDKPVLVSYPKAGRTWLRVLLDELGVEVHCTHDRSDHSKRAHFNTLRASKKDYAPRRVIFMARDPRDTVVSGFFQCTARNNYFAGDMAAFIRDPRHGMPKICHFYAQWARESLKLPQCYLVKYEDLHADCAHELQNLYRFLEGRDAPPERIEAALAAGKFDVMKSREKTGFYKEKFGDALTIEGEKKPEAAKTRRGKVGGFVDYLSSEDQKYCLEVMKNAGFPFEYGQNEA